MHALVAHGGERLATPAGRGTFFSGGARYLIGGYEYSADDLEHGVLRGNRPTPSSLGGLLSTWLPASVLPGPLTTAGRPFKDGDPRAAYVIDGPVDARLHAALVCGASSCPAIRTYTAANVDEGLDLAAEAFVAGDVEVRWACFAVPRHSLSQPPALCLCFAVAPAAEPARTVLRTAA